LPTNYTVVVATDKAAAADDVIMMITAYAYVYSVGGLNLGDDSRRQGILCGCNLQEVNKTKIVFVPQQYNIELRLEIRRHHTITSRRLQTASAK